MTEQFIKWFDEVFSEALFNGEEREYLKTYTWFAWRDSRREIGELCAYFSDGAYYSTLKAALKDGGDSPVALFEIPENNC